MSVSNDTSSVEAIIKALYESVSFEPHSQPDFGRLRTLFHPQGRLIPPMMSAATRVVALDVEEFIRNSREYIITSGMESKGFHEKEVKRSEESFGAIAHVFSVYESRHRSTDPEVIERGVNSIQLVKDQDRWWVVTVLWNTESPERSISKISR